MATRSYSRNTLDALSVMGQVINLRRKELKMSAGALAERVGISRGMLHRIEKGDPKCEIGVVFELASLLGVPLLAQDVPLSSLSDTLSAKIAVLPQSVRKTNREVNNDF
ncbi:helix-turn-helix transcriptional regulator [Pseudomonas putida]|uniref:Helix-turn-helix transcriptional regulator n=1 Tax=Pseudomonas putida TaxID=303 RepID=A0A8I1JM53_PSEPU|nr:helix-turn-helix transcriptional regulator [Pseudomonas putida]MBI6885130.1 helix-turn-helix transcriptional regulator [Pseudomonas putida]